ncbi:fungal zn(2)-Cys(6) binuclear cluster domain-containing protein [Pochonia chlamydosporia 170]|uniref:Fungal zn(2)-Cys(6) binuclear cluster domain-containing protein n=1 Tax=Pochonia chlamydosporia 170 TaxID=1380566 RepID=A0A179FIG4_METCM|nr:fungal zn(2)-Cys(6) binuclear cluster domain-containing protein [Pochonia chlamydosporia 170]OAQ65031.1 fungal zn(2)-Cys(6) binuclear cluster domain-containing protein [Pochonia chlamydosporia 170]
MSRQLRPLLPATARSTQDPDPALDAAGPSAGKRKKSTIAACEACRRRKTRCNGRRPNCQLCLSRGSECVYATDPAETHGQALKRKYGAQEERRNAHEEFYHLLRSRSEETVAAILQRVRAGASVDAIVQHVHSGDLLLQLAVSPDRRYHYSLGRVLNIPDFLMSASSCYMTSLVFRKISDPQWQWPWPSLQTRTGLLPNTMDYRAMYDAPFHVAQMVDVDVDAAKPSMWTNVSSDDELLRDLLKSYFTHEYLFFPFFHKDSFLQDMVSGRRRFCSSLLVNAILAASCHGHNKLPDRTEFWNPASLSYRFMAETRRLWELEADKKTITKVQAAMILHLEYNKNGLDKIGWSYCLQAVATAEEMGLLTTYLHPSCPKWRTAQEITAWIVFTWQGLQCFHFDRPPLVTAHPKIELPDSPESYGEVWVKYPTAYAPVPLHFSQIFKAICEFRTIMNDIMCSVFPPFSASKEGKIMLSAAQSAEYHGRLRCWYEQLPSFLNPRNLIIPIHFDVHMHYWFTTARLFEQVDVVEGENADSPPKQESPGEIVTHALANLQTLIRLYYSCHGNDTYNMFLIAMCSYIGFGALHNISSLNESAALIREAHESTALLCAGVLHAQSKNAYLSNIVFRLMQQSLPATVATELARFFHIGDVDQAKMAIMSRHIQSAWPVHVALMPGDINDRRLDNLLHAIRELSVDEDDKKVSREGSTDILES